METTIEKIMVIGAGAMGSGIAQVAAAKGYKVLLNDISMMQIENGMENVKKALSKRVEKGKMEASEMDKILENIEPAEQLSKCSEVQLIIEAAMENLELKINLFKACEEYCSDDTILASNTSSIPITEMAAGLSKPERFIGLHFFNPVPVMKLVEVIKGLKTSQSVARAAMDFVTDLGKEGVLVKDGPGFLVNRINNAMRNEAFACLAEGVASIEDIDKAMKYGLGHPMGPFELNDFAGLDIALAIGEVLWNGFREPKWRPFLPLKKLVQSGDLGVKTGKGWYDYTSGEKRKREDLNL